MFSLKSLFKKEEPVEFVVAGGHRFALKPKHVAESPSLSQLPAPIIIPDVDRETFALFAEWLKEKSLPNRISSPSLFCKLWVLAGAAELPRLQNAVMRRLRSSFMSAHSKRLSARALDYVSATTVPGVPLWDFVLEWCVRREANDGKMRDVPPVLFAEMVKRWSGFGFETLRNTRSPIELYPEAFDVQMLEEPALRSIRDEEFRARGRPWKPRTSFVLNRRTGECRIMKWPPEPQDPILIPLQHAQPILAYPPPQTFDAPSQPLPQRQPIYYPPQLQYGEPLPTFTQPTGPPMTYGPQLQYRVPPPVFAPPTESPVTNGPVNGPSPQIVHPGDKVYFTPVRADAHFPMERSEQLPTLRDVYDYTTDDPTGTNTDLSDDVSVVTVIEERQGSEQREVETTLVDITVESTSTTTSHSSSEDEPSTPSRRPHYPRPKRPSGGSSGVLTPSSSKRDDRVQRSDTSSLSIRTTSQVAENHRRFLAEDSNVGRRRHSPSPPHPSIVWEELPRTPPRAISTEPYANSPHHSATLSGSKKRSSRKSSGKNPRESPAFSITGSSSQALSSINSQPPSPPSTPPSGRHVYESVVSESFETSRPRTDDASETSGSQNIPDLAALEIEDRIRGGVRHLRFKNVPYSRAEKARESDWPSSQPLRPRQSSGDYKQPAKGQPGRNSSKPDQAHKGSPRGADRSPSSKPQGPPRNVRNGYNRDAPETYGQAKSGHRYPGPSFDALPANTRPSKDKKVPRQDFSGSYQEAGDLDAGIRVYKGPLRGNNVLQPDSGRRVSFSDIDEVRFMSPIVSDSDPEGSATAGAQQDMARTTRRYDEKSSKTLSQPSRHGTWVEQHVAQGLNSHPPATDDPWETRSSEDPTPRQLLGSYPEPAVPSMPSSPTSDVSKSSRSSLDAQVGGRDSRLEIPEPATQSESQPGEIGGQNDLPDPNGTRRVSFSETDELNIFSPLSSETNSGDGATQPLPGQPVWPELEQPVPPLRPRWPQNLDPAQRPYADPSMIGSDDSTLGQQDAPLTSRVPDGFEPPSRRRRED